MEYYSFIHYYYFHRIAGAVAEMSAHVKHFKMLFSNVMVRRFKWQRNETACTEILSQFVKRKADDGFRIPPLLHMYQGILCVCQQTLAERIFFFALILSKTALRECKPNLGMSDVCRENTFLAIESCRMTDN